MAVAGRKKKQAFVTFAQIAAWRHYTISTTKIV